MNMFMLCDVYITAVCSVDTTDYFLRHLRPLCRLRYPLDSSTYHLIKSPSGLGSDKLAVLACPALDQG
jgi:hypothetical protein